MTTRMSGFTAIELMVTLTVLAVLVSLAVPSFKELVAAQRLRTASFDLRSDLVFARSEALKRNQNVTIAPRLDGGWQTGWVVILDSTATELRTRNGVGAGVTVDSAADAITFNGGGRVSSPAGTVQIDLAAAAAHIARCLLLDPAGMPTTRADACQ